MIKPHPYLPNSAPDVKEKMMGGAVIHWHIGYTWPLYGGRGQEGDLGDP
jgi:hypothetical protein